MQCSDLSNNDHGRRKDARCSYTGDSSTENEDHHRWSDTADEGSELKDEDGKDDDVLGGEELTPLRVEEVEAEEGELGVSVAMYNKTAQSVDIRRSHWQAMGVQSGS